eukprot:scaffold5458_cov131-Isochrysis_galbana.AAC.5
MLSRCSLHKGINNNVWFQYAQSTANCKLAVQGLYLVRRHPAPAQHRWLAGGMPQVPGSRVRRQKRTRRLGLLARATLRTIPGELTGDEGYVMTTFRCIHPGLTQLPLSLPRPAAHRVGFWGDPNGSLSRLFLHVHEVETRARHRRRHRDRRRVTGGSRSGNRAVYG